MRAAQHFTLCLLLAACGGTAVDPQSPADPSSPSPQPTDPTPNPSPTPTKPNPTPTPTPTPPPPPPSDRVAVDLSGVWASRVINSQCFDGTIGKDTVQITTLSLVRLSQTGLEVSMSTEVCSVELSPYLDNVTSYPSPAVSAISIPDQTVMLDEAMSGVEWHPSKRVSLLGWSANGDPENEALPDEENDGRVLDADADGHPGITLNVEAAIDGDIYIVNRSVVETVGTVMNDDLILGYSSTVQQQNILDSSPGILRFNRIEATPNPDGESSTFEMVRLDDSATCADVVSSIFSEVPAATACTF